MSDQLSEMSDQLSLWSDTLTGQVHFLISCTARQEIQVSIASKPLVIYQKHFHLSHMLLSTLWQLKCSMLANFKCAWWLCGSTNCVCCC